MSDVAADARARVRTGPDPDAPARLERFLDAARAHEAGLSGIVPDAAAAELLALILGQSPALSRDLLREPERLRELSGSPWLGREKPLEVMRSELQAALASDESCARALRRYKAREYLRLGARELGHGRPDEVGRELAALASACLDAAVREAARELDARHGPPLAASGARCRFVALGMGKLGGQELNFSSDIDLICLYETDAGAAGDIGLHEYFTRLVERASRLVSEPTSDGSCFRVDHRLRPEGTRGPLVNSLEAAERYYESWGRPWERQAWIKARPVAGDLDLGDEALALLAPMVWPRAGRASAISDVRGLIARVRAELRDEEDVKLGRGGIREIEFFVQALQLLHGGRQPAIRERGTLRALDRLLFAGLVTWRERQLLGDAYVFLRRVEHRLQLAELRQTHALPRDADGRGLLARRLGYRDAAAFDAALAAQRDLVASIYATLGEAEGSAPAVATLVDPTADREAIERALGALGFRDPNAAADEVELLRAKPQSPFSPTADEAMAGAAARLLAEAAGCPDPDLALRRLVDLAVRGAPAQTLWRLSAQSDAVARRLASLLGTSEFLSRILVAQPGLGADLLARVDDHDPAPLDATGYAARLDPRLVDPAGAPLDEEAQLEAIRRGQAEELLRLGLRDVGGELDVEALGGALTGLAEACLFATLRAVRPAVEERWGRARTGLSVVGLGRLGASEMTWSSDLDVVFVFGDEHAAVDGGRGDVSAFEAMSRLAQRLLSGLSARMTAGRLYEVDTRLRPSGRQGALVSSLAGLVGYHAREAALWERQALLKARHVAGDRALGDEVERAVAAILWQPPPHPGWADEAAREIDRVRARQEKELAPRPGRHNVKTGPGGLVDIEFIVQYLQLVHGHDHPTVRLRSTARALDALGAAGLLPAGEHATLAGALSLLRRLENRLRIVEDRPRAEVGGEPHEIDKLARRLGYHGEAPGARLLGEYQATAEAVRGVYRRVFSVEDR